jgi:murein DD-endopeptidase MepM/ murein hydrolase activator NlpD
MHVRRRSVRRRITRQHLQGALLGVVLVAALGGLVATSSLSTMGRDLRWLGKRLVEKRQLIEHQRAQLAEFVAVTERLTARLEEASEHLDAVQAAANLEQAAQLLPAVATDGDFDLWQDPVERAIDRLLRLDEQADAFSDVAALLGGLLADDELWGGGVPSAWPVGGQVTSYFGMRASPTSGRWKMHPGMDISAPTGTAVEATAPGRVTFAGYRSGYGQTIVVDHGDSLKTLYAHLSRVHVARGELVEQNEVIGAVGSTGRTTGPHLHYEVRFRGRPVDPMCYSGAAPTRSRQVRTTLTTRG